MTRESSVMREVAFCLSHYGFFVIPQNTRGGDSQWSIWQEIDPARYVGAVWRSNTGALRNSRQQLVRFGIPGLPDWAGWLFKTGQRVSLEAKAEKGVLTKAQADHIALAILTGNLAGVVRSYADCETLLKSWGLSIPGVTNGGRYGASGV